MFKLLKEIPNPPRHLNIKGKIRDDIKYVSFIGSRKSTEYGRNTCKKLIQNLKGYDIGVVSGIGTGIDELVQKTALENEINQVAVLTSGINQIKPRTNKYLVEEIIDKGGVVVSEYGENKKETKDTVLEANRIIVGISDTSILIECQSKSNEMVKAYLTLEYNRDLGVVPHNIFSKEGEGCNYLIKEGARLITDAEEILNMVGIETIQKR